MFFAAEWTPEQVTSLVNIIMTGLLAIVGAVTAYLMKRQTNRAEEKLDNVVVTAKQNADTLKKQDVVLATQSAKIEDISQSVASK